MGGAVLLPSFLTELDVGEMDICLFGKVSFFFSFLNDHPCFTCSQDV